MPRPRKTDTEYITVKRDKEAVFKKLQQSMTQSMNKKLASNREIDRDAALKKARRAITFARKRQDEMTPFRKREPLTELQSNEFFKALQLDLFKAIFPIPAAITNTVITFYNSMTPDQRNDLCQIGRSFADLPFDWLSGEKSAEECYRTCVDGLENLSRVFTDNPTLLIKIGSSILTSVLPFGNFLGKAIETVSASGLMEDYKQPITRALNGSLSAFGDLVNTIATGPRP